MLRGHLNSVELLRALFNPMFKRNLTASTIRYTDEKDRKKSDGMFSWLKDILKTDDRAVDVRNTIDHSATVPRYSTTDQITLINMKLEETSTQNFNTSEKPLENFHSSAAVVFEDQMDSTSDTSALNYSPDTEPNKFEIHNSSSLNNVTDNRNSKCESQWPLLQRSVLSIVNKVNHPVRTFMNCAPRNTKPPIREPNMPEKQEKKDENKEKKKKKPVIRMETGQTVSDSCQNEVNVEAESKLHDNMDVNFQYQWGVRFPEEVMNSQQLENTTSFIGDTNYSTFQVSPTYEIDAIQPMKNLHFSMSSTKESENKVDANAELSNEPLDKAVEATSSDASAERAESANTDSLKKILKTSPNVMKETSVVDEDYNVPSDGNFDAEISAWKDLVLKSKVPLDPSKEEFLGSNNVSHAEMLSIRPEPPQPKLDVQAVPTSSGDAAKDEEEESELPKDYKVNVKTPEVKRTSSPSDIQKLDSKKLHTGPFCSERYDAGNGLKRKLKLHDSSMSLNDGFKGNNEISLGMSGYSTNAESGWGNFEDKKIPKEMGEARREQEDDRQGNVANSQEIKMNENVPSNEAGMTEERRHRSDAEMEFTESRNTVPEREIDVPLSHMQQSQDARENPVLMSQRESRKFETDEPVHHRSDNFQGNFEYPNTPYEDDFYSGYESMMLEPVIDKPTPEQSQQSPPHADARDEQQQAINNQEMFTQDTQQFENTGEYITDNNYIKVPGDPYPYSREHFNKWRMHNDYIPLGPIKQLENEDIINPTISNPSTEQVAQQPVRKMSHYSQAQETQDKDVRQ